MVSFFSDYLWDEIHIDDVHKTYTHTLETVTIEQPHHYYQLGLKWHGKTDMWYNGQYIRYYDNTVVYLPMDRTEKIHYVRQFIEKGDGACIFFRSSQNLPPKPYSIDCTDYPKVTSQFMKFANLYDSSFLRDNLAMTHDFYGLLTTLRNAMEMSERRNSPITSKEQSRLAPAVAYIEAHYLHEYCDSEFLASLCGMSCDYFRHVFRAVYHIPPLQYINGMKIEYAKKLLSEGNSVAKAANLSGFLSENYFIRIFRKYIGLTPKKYRDSMMQ